MKISENFFSFFPTRNQYFPIFHMRQVKINEKKRYLQKNVTGDGFELPSSQLLVQVCSTMPKHLLFITWLKQKHKSIVFRHKNFVWFYENHTNFVWLKPHKLFVRFFCVIFQKTTQKFINRMNSIWKSHKFLCDLGPHKICVVFITQIYTGIFSV